MDKPPPYTDPSQGSYNIGFQQPQQPYPGYVSQGVPPTQMGYPGYVSAQPAPGVVIVSGAGACPYCHVGYPREDYPCCAICLAIWFFPIGILCCLAMKERVCSHCGRNL